VALQEGAQRIRIVRLLHDGKNFQRVMFEPLSTGRK